MAEQHDRVVGVIQLRNQAFHLFDALLVDFFLQRHLPEGIIQMLRENMGGFKRAIRRA